VSVTLIQADARQIPLADKSVQCCVTSPPYWGLRDYGVAGQLGLEKTPEEYVASMIEVFREVKRVLRDDGTLWLNLGDSYATGAGSGRSMGGDCFGKQNKVIDESSYPECQPNRMPIAGLKPKDLVGIPWMLAFALRADGWYLRSDIIWSKPNPMPESVTDRPTKAHEYIFLLSKSERYFYAGEAIAEHAIVGWNGSSFTSEQDVITKPNLGSGPRNVDGHRSAHMAGTQRNDGDRWRTADGGVAPRGLRNKRTVWEVATNPFPEAHFATFPEDLIKPCILAGCPAGGTVLDPFMGSGTTALVARNLQCHAVGLELNAAYIQIAAKRLSQEVLDFSGGAK
jgi:DNA modification methylase